MTDRYAVTGHPIGHSKSPQIHTEFARLTQQDMVYTAIEAPLGGFAPTVDRFREQGGRGLNVTLPFKLDACAYADERSEDAELAGAANCLQFEGGRCLARNYDGVGLVRDIVHNLGHALQGRRVLLMGAGGATRGTVLAILREDPALVWIANRTADKARELAHHFHGHGASSEHLLGGGYGDIGAQRFDVVINATSASLSEQAPDLPASAYAPGCLAYDMVYGQGLTAFLQQAQRHGAGRLADGLGMLVEQAAEAFDWWRGVRPPTAGLLASMQRLVI